LKSTWQDGPNASYDSTAYRAAPEQAARAPGEVVRNACEPVAAAMSSAPRRRVEAEYYIPHMAQARMEPPAATRAHRRWPLRGLDGDAGASGNARPCLEAGLGLPFDRVTVNVTLLRRRVRAQVKPDYVVEAALLSRADERSAGESDLDARGSTCSTALSHGLGRAPGGRASMPPASLSRGCIGACRRVSLPFSAPTRSMRRHLSVAWG